VQRTQQLRGPGVSGARVGGGGGVQRAEHADVNVAVGEVGAQGN
jgi:hypothetical protein